MSSTFFLTWLFWCLNWSKRCWCFVAQVELFLTADFQSGGKIQLDWQKSPPWGIQHIRSRCPINYTSPSKKSAWLHWSVVKTWRYVTWGKFLLCANICFAKQYCCVTIYHMSSGWNLNFMPTSISASRNLKSQILAQTFFKWFSNKIWWQDTVEYLKI